MRLGAEKRNMILFEAARQIVECHNANAAVGGRLNGGNRWARRLIYLLLVLGGGFACVPSQSHAEVPLNGADRLSRFVENYCVQCHNDSDRVAGMSLESFEIPDDPALWETERWEQIARRLQARQMPPLGADRPSEAEYAEVWRTLAGMLDERAEKFPQPGRTDSIRRLNRTEYQNAIRDLLGVEVDVQDLLPADASGHGFDNVTVGELSPVLLSRYISAAEKISRLAMGGLESSPGGVTVRVPADRSQDSHVPGLPLGTRGGLLFEHHFVRSGEYEIALRLMRDRDENVEGLHEPHEIDVLIDKRRVHRFTVKPGKGGEGYQKDDTLVDANLNARFQVTAGPRQVGVTFPRKFASLSEIRRQPFEASFNRHRHPRKAPAIFQVSITGPFDPEQASDTPSRSLILIKRPERPEEASECAELIFRKLLRKAYRRPVDDEDLAMPMRFFEQAYPADGFDAGIEAGISAILVNPHFLFRVEGKDAEQEGNSVSSITDIELASRLSFFLWSSLPDEELLKLAENNTLRRPEVLKQQVQRMLQDERSRSLVENFAAQWLYLRNLDRLTPDRRLFPDFDDNLRHAMRRETELLLDRIVREDRSVLELIRPESIFLNARLAKHYGVPGIQGSHFRPVAVDKTNGRRGGLFRQASILAVTSYATRTSPTVRGNWILENILGTPPPPPPPNTPGLADEPSSGVLTIRERLAEHRANPACASCHDLMDPIGFALENYDALGRWRIFDQGLPIDSSGQLPDGHEISSVRDLESGILARPEMFVGTLVEKLLTFALGRGVESFDGPSVRKIVRDASAADYQFSTLITGIVMSTPFQMRASE